MQHTSLQDAHANPVVEPDGIFHYHRMYPVELDVAAACIIKFGKQKFVAGSNIIRQKPDVGVNGFYLSPLHTLNNLGHNLCRRRDMLFFITPPSTMESRNANSSRIGCRSKLSRPVISKGEPSEKGRPSLEQIPSQLSKNRDFGNHHRKQPSCLPAPAVPPDCALPHLQQPAISAGSPARSDIARGHPSMHEVHKSPSYINFKRRKYICHVHPFFDYYNNDTLPQYHEQQSNTIEWQQEVLSRTKNLK